MPTTPVALSSVAIGPASEALSGLLLELFSAGGLEDPGAPGFAGGFNPARGKEKRVLSRRGNVCLWDLFRFERHAVGREITHKHECARTITYDALLHVRTKEAKRHTIDRSCAVVQETSCFRQTARFPTLPSDAS